jgi:hypothetical protein
VRDSRDEKLSREAREEVLRFREFVERTRNWG